MLHKSVFYQLPFQLVLASGSPRRQELMRNLGLQFEVKPTHADESFPQDLKAERIPLYLAEKKAESYFFENDNEVVLTADTIVWLEDTVLNKPENPIEAKKMLEKLSGNMHHVFTAVCIKSKTNKMLFYDSTKVYFKPLKDEEINYYIQNYPVYDKAGGYGVQDWLGYIGIEKIDGCFYNVMGLPIRKVSEHLLKFKP
jgi:septum formation protein